MSQFASLTRKYCVEVTSSTASIYCCPIEFFAKFIQERPKFKVRVFKNYKSRKAIRENYLKFASYGECETLLNILRSQESPREELVFRKSVGDLNCKLLLNPLRIGADSQKATPKKLIQRYEKGLLRNKNAFIPKISFHDKVISKIKLNQDKVIEKLQKHTFVLSEESGNKRLQKQMQDIKAKFLKKETEEIKSTSNYFTMSSSFRKLRRDDHSSERDNIDEILTERKSKFFGENPLTKNRKINQFSLEPDIWTPRSDIN